jgi:hypothetical protein
MADPADGPSYECFTPPIGNEIEHFFRAEARLKYSESSDEGDRMREDEMQFHVLKSPASLR